MPESFTPSIRPVLFCGALCQDPTREGLNNGTYPDDVELQVGSRIKLWAHNTHVDIGFAYAHPSIDGHPRFAHCR